MQRSGKGEIDKGMQTFRGMLEEIGALMRDIEAGTVQGKRLYARTLSASKGQVSEVLKKIIISAITLEVEEEPEVRDVLLLLVESEADRWCRVFIQQIMGRLYEPYEKPFDSGKMGGLPPR